MAWAVLPVMDGMAKHLSMELPVLEVVWARYFFMVVLTLPISFLFFRKHLTWPKSIKIQLARSTFLFITTILIFLCNFYYIFTGDTRTGICSSHYCNFVVSDFFKRTSWFTTLDCCYRWFCRRNDNIKTGI